MDETNNFKFYINIPEHEVIAEDGMILHRIYFQDADTIDKVIKLLEDLKIYAKYHSR